MDLYHGMSEEEYTRVMGREPDFLPDDHPKRAWRARMIRDGRGNFDRLQKGIINARKGGKVEYRVVHMYDRKDGSLKGQVLMANYINEMFVGLSLTLGEVNICDVITKAKRKGVTPNADEAIWALIANYLPEFRRVGMDIDVYHDERAKGLLTDGWAKCLETCGEHGLHVVTQRD